MEGEIIEQRSIRSQRLSADPCRRFFQMFDPDVGDKALECLDEGGLELVTRTRARRAPDQKTCLTPNSKPFARVRRSVLALPKSAWTLVRLLRAYS